MVSSYDQITGQCYLKAPTDSDTVYCSNDRFVTYKVARDSTEANSFVELWILPPFAVAAAVALRSLPAENARFPAPVTIATQDFRPV